MDFDPNNLSNGLFAFLGSGVATYLSRKKIASDLASLRAYVGRLARFTKFDETPPASEDP